MVLEKLHYFNVHWEQNADDGDIFLIINQFIQIPIH